MWKLEKYNNIITGFSSNVLGNILMFATTIYLTRTYNPEIYGEFRLIFSFIALAVMILLLGRDTGIVYHSQVEKESIDTVIKEEVYFGLLILLLGSFLIYVFSSDILPFFLNNDTNLRYFQISLLMIPLWGTFNLLLASLKSKGLINYTFVLSNLTQRTLRIPFFVLISLLSTSYYSLAFSMILSQVILILLAIKRLTFSFYLVHFNINNFFRRLGYSIQLGFNTIIIVLLSKIDVLMIGKYLDNTQVAIYDTSVLLSFVVMLPFIALVKSSEPFMRNLIEDKGTQHKYIKNLRLSIDLSLGVLLFIIIASNDVMKIFGDIYIEGAEVLIILAASNIVLVMLGSPIEILNMNGLTVRSSILLILTILLNIILNIILIPRYGINGAGIATGVSLIFTKLISLLLIKKVFNLNFICQFIPLRSIVPFLMLLAIGFFGSFQFWGFQIIYSLALTSFFYFFLGFTQKTYRKKLFEIIKK